MRTLMLLSIVVTLSTLAGCGDDTQPTTAPTTSARVTPAPSAQVSDGVSNQGRAQANGLTITTIESNEFVVPGGAVAGSIACPAGTARVGGGYAFTNEGNWSPVSVTMNEPFGTNGWFVRVVNAATGHISVGFKVYALCAS